MFQRSKGIVAALGFIALATGCGKNADPEPAAEAAAPPADDSPANPRADHLDACHLRVTSPEAKEFQTTWNPRGKILLNEGPSFVRSTYWASDEEHQKYVDAKAPPLEIVCSVPNDNGEAEIAVTLSPAQGLGEANVPYAPGKYPVVPRSADPNAPQGFWVFPLFYGPAMFEATGGTLTITRFDTNGVAGSFQAQGTEQFGSGRMLVIEGTFDMPCRGGPSEEKCTAGKAIMD